MRLITYRAPSGHERLGVLADGRVLPADGLSAEGPATIAEVLSRGEEGLADLRRAADEARIQRDGVPLATLELLAPVPRPGKVVAIGRNYKEHAAEENQETPPAPLIFAKWPSSVVGPGAEIRWDPALTSGVDYEAELAVVIGKPARRVSEADALGYVLGYTCLNDVSARDIQFADGQWVRGKSLDTFCPLGPVLVTTDEIPDPQCLAISCAVNGERLQSSNTAQMIFNVATLVSYCSRSFTLEPGDVIATGTPSGVGWFRTPRKVLTDGDEVVVSIERIGELRNVCRFDRATSTESA